MHETSAQGWCTGKTQRDGMEREVGRGMVMGNTCKSMADSCQCMAKTTTTLQLIKINEKKMAELTCEVILSWTLICWDSLVFTLQIEFQY